ncbi:HTH-type transcriptional regulator PrtR [bacterium HR37]|nr:HTH-type transcriptional regulator PrtR [bacterium HR37]
MNEKESFTDRLKLLRVRLRLSQKKFAQAIGFSQSYYSEIEKGKVHPTERLLKLIEQTFNVNPRWLREGEGEMFLEEGKPEAKPLKDEGLKLIPLRIRGVWYPGQDLSQYDKNDLVLIPVYHEVDAGNAERNHTSLEPIDWVPVPVSKLTNRSFGVKVVGDSMEPTIPDGSIVVVDPNQKRIVDGKIYVLEIPYIGVTVKRVFIDYPNIILKADNPSYKAQTIPLEKIESEELRIVGRVTVFVSYDA